MQYLIIFFFKLFFFTGSVSSSEKTSPGRDSNSSTGTRSMKRSVSDLNDSTSGVAGGLKAGPRDLSMRSDNFFSAQTSLNSTVTGKYFQDFSFLSIFYEISSHL